MDTSITIRTNKEVREKAQKIFGDLGITTSAGINMFLRQVIAEKGIPFTPTRDPQALRKKWDKEVEEALHDYQTGKQKGFTSAEELHAWLESL